MLICPVQSRLKKYSDFPKSQITLFLVPFRLDMRGGSRSSRTRGGMRWTRELRLTSVAQADGEDVWS